MAEASKDTNLLSVLIYNYVEMCLVQLGKIQNPNTGKVETNLDGARFCIEMLKMLRRRMEGNLSKDEAAMFDDQIGFLQMNFVEESSGQHHECKCGHEGCGCGHDHEGGDCHCDDDCDCHGEGGCDCKKEQE